jgi:OOP family OmpA-OmpF porin
MTLPVVTDEPVTDLPAEALTDQSVQPDSQPHSVRSSDGPQPSPLDRLNELRRLLFGAEQEQLGQLNRRINDPHQQTETVSRVLPGAIRLRSQPDRQLTSALTPAVEDSIAASVRSNPKRLSDALYPIIGPAIRAAVAHTLSSMIQSLNETLNRSFSWQGLQWRLEALRTGKPFAEIVLLHTLLYRVEQVLLIHRQTGLLLQQIVAPAIAAQDPQLVSGMLTAIQDFVRDSFVVRQSDALETLEMGELNVWTVQGPEAVLAVVIRGEAPEELRPLFEEVLEKIHLEQGADLADFNGDPALFEASRPELERCLQSQLANVSAAQSQKKISPVLVAIPLLLALLLGWWWFTSWRDSRRWQDYLSRLKSEPGIVVVENETRGNQYFISGLRDPLAADPAELIRATPLDPARVSSRWQPYQDLSPQFILARARQLLQPPPGVELKFENGILHASGPAPPLWSQEAQKLARALPGVLSLRTDGTGLIDAIHRLTIRFSLGSAELTPDQNSQLDKLADLIRQVSQSVSAPAEFRLVITGNADETGSLALNLKLREARAAKVKAALAAREIAVVMRTEVGQRNSRDVTFQALLTR